MTVKITWLNDNVIQFKKLVKHRSDHIPYYSFTMNSPIYEAIEDNSFMLFGIYPFKAEEAEGGEK